MKPRRLLLLALLLAPFAIFVRPSPGLAQSPEVKAHEAFLKQQQKKQAKIQKKQARAAKKWRKQHPPR